MFNEFTSRPTWHLLTQTVNLGVWNIHLLSLQADSPDAKDQLACLEMEHQNTLREVSREGTKDTHLNSTHMNVV